MSCKKLVSVNFVFVLMFQQIPHVFAMDSRRGGTYIPSGNDMPDNGSSNAPLRRDYTPTKMIFVGYDKDREVALYREDKKPDPFWKRFPVLFLHQTHQELAKPQATQLGMFVINSYNSASLSGDTIDEKDLLEFQERDFFQENKTPTEEYMSSVKIHRGKSVSPGETITRKKVDIFDGEDMEFFTEDGRACFRKKSSS